MELRRLLVSLGLIVLVGTGTVEGSSKKNASARRGKNNPSLQADQKEKESAIPPIFEKNTPPTVQKKADDPSQETTTIPTPVTPNQLERRSGTVYSLKTPQRPSSFNPVDPNTPQNNNTVTGLGEKSTPVNTPAHNAISTLANTPEGNNGDFTAQYGDESSTNKDIENEISKNADQEAKILEALEINSQTLNTTPAPSMSTASSSSSDSNNNNNNTPSTAPGTPSRRFGNNSWPARLFSATSYLIKKSPKTPQRPSTFPSNPGNLNTPQNNNTLPFSLDESTPAQTPTSKHWPTVKSTPKNDTDSEINGLSTRYPDNTPVPTRDLQTKLGIAAFGSATKEDLLNSQNDPNFFKKFQQKYSLDGFSFDDWKSFCEKKREELNNPMTTAVNFGSLSGEGCIPLADNKKTDPTVATPSKEDLGNNMENLGTEVENFVEGVLMDTAFEFAEEILGNPSTSAHGIIGIGETLPTQVLKNQNQPHTNEQSTSPSATTATTPTKKPLPMDPEFKNSINETAKLSAENIENSNNNNNIAQPAVSSSPTTDSHNELIPAQADTNNNNLNQQYATHTLSSSSSTSSSSTAAQPSIEKQIETASKVIFLEDNTPKKERILATLDEQLSRKKGELVYTYAVRINGQEFRLPYTTFPFKETPSHNTVYRLPVDINKLSTASTQKRSPRQDPSHPNVENKSEKKPDVSLDAPIDPTFTPYNPFSLTSSHPYAEKSERRADAPSTPQDAVSTSSYLPSKYTFAGFVSAIGLYKLGGHISAPQSVIDIISSITKTASEKIAGTMVEKVFTYPATPYIAGGVALLAADQAVQRLLPLHKDTKKNIRTFGVGALGGAGLISGVNHIGKYVPDVGTCMSNLKNTLPHSETVRAGITSLAHNPAVITGGLVGLPTSAYLTSKTNTPWKKRVILASGTTLGMGIGYGLGNCTESIGTHVARMLHTSNSQILTA